MLRITVEKPATLKLDGKLSGPWVDELERSWGQLLADQPAKRVVVDLSDVNFIDIEGKKLLSWMFRQGADLRNASLMTKYIVDQIRRGQNGRENRRR